MVIAALMAGGTSEIEEIGHIERGYENIVEKLRGLGADIRKVERVPAALDQACETIRAAGGPVRNQKARGEHPLPPMRRQGRVPPWSCVV